VLAVYQPGEPPLEYATGTFGKPYVDGSLCQFNISHSSDSLAIAVSLSQVGVDIERKRYVNPHQLARACMSEAERADLSLMSEPAALEYFFRIWTAKEALLKAAGLGLQIDPKQISLTISKEIRIDALPARLGSLSDWSISTLGLVGNMAAALATAGSPSNIRILHCSVDAGAVDVLPTERTMGA
jgi:4'-phosphopantetheinyl transferase